jgi:hypothetical protein
VSGRRDDEHGTTGVLGHLVGEAALEELACAGEAT